MNRLAVAALAWLLWFGPVVSWAQSPPAPPPLTAPVNDFAGVIDADDEAALDALIRKLQAASGDVVVVATIKTFQPSADIRLYATEMFQNHGRGIGQKGQDNGLLLLLAVDDREVWAEVGYDLEGIITDGFAGETSRQVMVPFFRQGNYGGGMVAGTTRFVQRIAQARNVTLEGVPVREPARRDDGSGGFPFGLLIFLAILLINGIQSAINRMMGRTRRRRGRRWSSTVGPFGPGYGGWSSGGGGWSSGGGGGFGGGFGGFGGGRSGGGGGGASW